MLTCFVSGTSRNHQRSRHRSNPAIVALNCLTQPKASQAEMALTSKFLFVCLVGLRIKTNWVMLNLEDEKMVGKIQKYLNLDLI